MGSGRQERSLQGNDLSLALLLLTGVGMLWLMGRLFCVQTLLSGESISLRRVWSALRG